MANVTPATISVHPVPSSICARKGSRNRLYWFPSENVKTLEDAFETYILPKFYSEYEAAQAFEDFIEVLGRAKKGDLKPIYEIRLINPATTKPEIIYEIKTHWNNTSRSAKTLGYVGARLFHGEPSEKPASVICVHLLCKIEYQDDEDGWLKQTGAAKQAAFRYDECRRGEWAKLVEFEP